MHTLLCFSIVRKSLRAAEGKWRESQPSASTPSLCSQVCNEMAARMHNDQIKIHRDVIFFGSLWLLPCSECYCAVLWSTSCWTSTEEKDRNDRFHRAGRLSLPVMCKSMSCLRMRVKWSWSYRLPMYSSVIWKGIYIPTSLIRSVCWRERNQKLYTTPPLLSYARRCGSRGVGCYLSRSDILSALCRNILSPKCMCLS